LAKGASTAGSSARPRAVSVPARSSFVSAAAASAIIAAASSQSSSCRRAVWCSAAPAAVRLTWRRSRVQQPGAQRGLQPGDLLAERGLGQMQPPGGAGEVQLVGDSHEGPQVAQLDIHSQQL